MIVDARPVRASDDVIARDVAGEMVLLNLETGIYFGLDAVGCRVWERLADEGATLAQLTDLVEAEFDAPRDVIERDLQALLEQFIENRLIEPVEA